MKYGVNCGVIRVITASSARPLELVGSRQYVWTLSSAGMQYAQGTHRYPRQNPENYKPGMAEPSFEGNLEG